MNGRAAVLGGGGILSQLGEAGLDKSSSKIGWKGQRGHVHFLRSTIIRRVGADLPTRDRTPNSAAQSRFFFGWGFWLDARGAGVAGTSGLEARGVPPLLPAAAATECASVPGI